MSETIEEEHARLSVQLRLLAEAKYGERRTEEVEKLRARVRMLAAQMALVASLRRASRLPG